MDEAEEIAALLILLAGGVSGGVIIAPGGDEKVAPPPPPQRTSTEVAEEPRRAQAAEREEEEPASRRRAPLRLTVDRGDTLWDIATDQLGRGASNGQIARRVNRLARINDLGDPDLIRTGQRLRLRR